MLVQIQRRYGADEHPQCLVCGDLMSLTTRTPHSDYGAGYERQTFACRKCRREMERSADSHLFAMPTSTLCRIIAR
jgi:hypothetical protein